MPFKNVHFLSKKIKEAERQPRRSTDHFFFCSPSEINSSQMAKLKRETVRGEEEVWVHGTRERTDAAGTRAENLERPRRHVLEKVSIG
jgi:hypothetical protein